MKNELLIVILSSTVLATVITCIFNYIVNNKNHVSDNIIAERKLWREVMRNISNELNTAMDEKAIRVVVAKIKVNINAFGYKNSSNYMQDGHIWKVIRAFEKEKKIDNDLAMKYKNILTNMISALLKYDWERSKGEIKGNLQIRGIILTNVICTIAGIISSGLYSDIFEDNIIQTTSEKTIALLMIVVGCFTTGIYSLICIVNRYILSEIKKEMLWIKLAGGVIGTIVVLWAIIDNVVGREAVLQLIGQEYRIAVNFQTAALIISGILALEFIWKAYYNQRIYFLTILDMEKSWNS